MAKNNLPIILTIDDDAVILNSVLAILSHDYNVIPFICGKSALTYLETHSADLILLDYQMPLMSGFQVLEKLQSDPKTMDIPVIFFTGNADGNFEAEVLEKGVADYIAKPLKAKVLLTRVSLQLELYSYRKNLESNVLEQAENLHHAYNKLKMREDLTLSLLAKVTDLRDHDTGQHIARTTEYVRIIVEHIFFHPEDDYILSESDAEDIIKSVKLHDLGKVAVPDHILLKPGKLTNEEFDIIKQHPVFGADLLDEFIEKMEDDDSFLNTARDVCYSHHEKWNGTGYPKGLKGDLIPLSARIAAIADVYDSLTSFRPYKKAFDHDKATSIIKEDSGTHFDPYLVTIFLDHINEFKAIAEEHKYTDRGVS